jgi:serine/threonine-protein kinase
VPFAKFGKKMVVRLAVVEGPQRGQEFVFVEHDLFLVGRSRNAHYRLPDDYFSRLHFLLEVNPPRCRLKDLGSQKGTYVNGKKVDDADLSDGDLIQGGSMVLRLSVEAPGEMPATARYRALSLPTGSAESGPAKVRRPKSSPEAENCLACGTPLVGYRPGPLCSACRERTEREPQTIPGYRIVKELGRGGMGVVSLALRAKDDLPVALKSVIPAAAGSRANIDRFFREARTLQHLDHPHIASFLEMGQANGQLFFTSEYVPGVDAARLLKEQGLLPVQRAVALMCQLLEALEYAHEQGFVHRDIKPRNLLVRAIPDAPGRDFVKLSDFGLARVYEASPMSGLTVADDVDGISAFTPPELITAFRECKPPMDQYSAGATLYNLITNTHVYDFPINPIERLLTIMTEDPVPILHRRSDLPPALAEIIHRSLARDPKNRFPDVWTMRAALAEFA